MNVLVDTSVWSLVLRRTGDVDHPEAAELRALIADLAVRIIGPIRQEILSGIKSGAQFDQLRENTQGFSRSAAEFSRLRTGSRILQYMPPAWCPGFQHRLSNLRRC